MNTDLKKCLSSQHDDYSVGIKYGRYGTTHTCGACGETKKVQDTEIPRIDYLIVNGKLFSTEQNRFL